MMASTSKIQEEHWDTVIQPKQHLLDFQLAEVWRYRDLLGMFVRRDVVTVYKQTVLGPVWYVVQPILMTAIYVLVFGRIAKISTDGLPQILFYLSGIVLWNYFSETFTLTSKTFKENESIFGKVYFPRIIMPMSKIVSGLIKFGIQFGFFITVYLYYGMQGYAVSPTVYVVYLPLLILLMAGLSLGCGIIFTSLTSKYRDLTFLIQFGVQLLMYATPIIYPVSTIPQKYAFIIQANPMTPIVEGFRYALLGAGNFDFGQLGYSAGFTLVLLVTGIIIFNKTEKTFMDTV